MGRAALAILAGLGWRIPSAGPGIERSGKDAGQGNEASAFAAAVEDVRTQAVQYLGGLGFEQIPAASILTGHAHNGGLRYDESGVLDRAGSKRLIVQDCARVEDIQELDRLGVLPHFHILACSHGGERDIQAGIQLCLDVLTEQLGLQRENLALVSTDMLLPHRTVLDPRGISGDGRILIRDAAKARTAGDGSGYFHPKGHPAATGFHTAGVYAWVGKGAPPARLAYPMAQGWVEVAEIVLEPDVSFAFGIGLERVVLARGGRLPSWQESLANLLVRIEAEARESRQGLPPGHAMFRASEA
jgi:hypothetical protein